MNRRKELLDSINKANAKADGKGMNRNEWVLLLLSDVAMSLAVIADALSREEEDD